MAFFVVAYEKTEYDYRIVEAATWDEALTKARNHYDVQNVLCEGDFYHSTERDSGPWRTLDRAREAAEDGEFLTSDVGEKEESE